MSFEFCLDTPVSVPPEDPSNVAYDPEKDDVRSILRDICASLSELPGVQLRLTVGGPLRVSVRRDLVVVMEQLREVLAGLRMAGTATLDLYEQGVERQLVFAQQGARTRILQRDLVGKQNPTHEVIVPSKTVVESLRTLASTFVNVARYRSPQRCARPWFTDWEQTLLAAAAP